MSLRIEAIPSCKDREEWMPANVNYGAAPAFDNQEQLCLDLKMFAFVR